jgi:5'-3' exoribonuclease 2
MMTIIFEFIDKIFAIVRPRKLLYMAIDGVAPRAKMNQQRSRRFRAAKDAYEKSSEIRRLKEQIIANGGVVPPDVPQSEKFDSNCITPGTPFMDKLATCLRYYVHDRLNSDPGWKNLTVILSDANVPGEGEHKIMDFIRRQRANPDHDPNTHHVLCGADADLIMLGLATHEPHFTIIREEFRPDKPRPCEICAQYGHDTKECQGTAREKQGAFDEMANTFTSGEQHYIFLRLSILREYLQKELFVPNLAFPFDIERAIDDWVFMCFFVGNDFLPHLPSLEIREGAIDRLVNLYKTMISKSDGYLTDCGDVNLERCQFILSAIGEVEDDIFKKRQKDELMFRQRQKEKKNRNKYVNGDMPVQMPEWMKSGPYAPVPLGRNFVSSSSNSKPVSTTNKFEALNIEQNDDKDDKRGVKRKANEASTSKQDACDAPLAVLGGEVIPPEKIAQIIDKDIVVVEEVVEDEDANDPVRLWEDGWRGRYYKIKFDISEEDDDFRHKVARHYALGLIWVLKYYYQGVPAWNWYFPYHYAPFASDFFNIADMDIEFDTASQPFRPFEQLMSVFPAASKKHLPEPWQPLMTEKTSPIIDFYPEDFQVDLNGKKQSWQGVALLPFVDEARLKSSLEPYHEYLTEEEKRRNTRGNDRLFVGRHHKLYDFFKDMYANPDGKKFQNFKHSVDLNTTLSGGIGGKVWYDEYVVLENETYPSPLRFYCQDIENNKVLSVHYHDPVYDSEYVFRANILDGAVMPDAVLKPGDYDPNRGQYRPRTGFNPNNNYRQNRHVDAANRMIK